MLSVAGNSLEPRGDIFRYAFKRLGVCPVPDTKFKLGPVAPFAHD
jgi:hypothetical protein